jgi:ABC-type glutathione transport system ATPase component
MATAPQASPEVLLRAVELRKSFGPRGLFSSSLKALDGVSLSIPRRSCTALIGESGSGKSTLAASLVRLEDADEGEVWFEGTNLSQLGGEALRSRRAGLQLIFQDASAALNPRFTATELVEEPLVIQKIGTPTERHDRATEMLRTLGIPEERHNSRPPEFSGGQRKRIALARALVLRPRLLILDEVFAGLDLLIANEILSQLMELRSQQDLTLLFTSHDLSFLARRVDSIAVMQHGKIVEQGSACDILSRPQHPYTKSLISAHERLQRTTAKGAGQ